MHPMYQGLPPDTFASSVMPFVMLLQHVALCYPGLGPPIPKPSALVFQSFSDGPQLHFSFLAVCPLFLAYLANLLKRVLLLLSGQQFLILELRLSALRSFVLLP